MSSRTPSSPLDPSDRSYSALSPLAIRTHGLSFSDFIQRHLLPLANPNPTEAVGFYSFAIEALPSTDGLSIDGAALVTFQFEHGQLTNTWIGFYDSIEQARASRLRVLEALATTISNPQE